jgi:hypothetical protein
MNNFPEDQVAVEIATVINPFYVFNGSVDPAKFVELQIKLISSLGPDEYFQTQLAVMHSSLSKLLKVLNYSKDDDAPLDGCEANVNIIGNC